MTTKRRIYMYTFPNGKRYIGATCQTLAKRQGKNWQRYQHCTSVWNAIQEFGIESIKQEILFEGEISVQEVKELERGYISQYKTFDPQYGYNTRCGGDGLDSKDISEERRHFLQEQMYNLGKKNKERIVSEETRQKQRIAKLGIKRGALSQETKDKISKANSRENMSEETRLRRIKSKQKKVIVTNNETKEIMVFESGEDTANYFNVKPSAVSRWISGTRKPKNGYTFKFFTNND